MKKEPRIKQIIPINDMWMKNVDETGVIHFDKVIAMALVDNGNFDTIHYLCRCDVEYIDGLENIQDPEMFFFTHEINPELLKLSYNKP